MEMTILEDYGFEYFKEELDKNSRIKLGKEQLRGAEEFLEKQSVKYINELPIKEKAKEIYDLMKGSRVKNSHRKKCALIAVDEIINACEYNRVESYNTDWWNKVKIEINKL